MKKEKIIIAALAVFANVIFFCGVSFQKMFIVNGYIKGLHEKYIYLSWQQGDDVKIDSMLVADGHFQFKGHVVDPSLAVVYIRRQSPVRFYLENAKIEINGQVDSLQHIRIKGSVTQNESDAFTLQIEGVKAENERIKQTSDFIKNHPNSYLSLDKLQELSTRIDYKTLAKLFAGFAEPLKLSVVGKRLEKQVLIYKNTSVGSMAPTFSQKDLNGKQISLESLRGKYVLLDFWASWCVPCRKENPTVLKAYNRFYGKGLVIFAVSLDNKYDSWKKAVEEDQLPWLQVSDLNGTNNVAAVQYGIFSIPANFLINPEGKIVAKNLRGEALEQTLAAFL